MSRWIRRSEKRRRDGVDRRGNKRQRRKVERNAKTRCGMYGLSPDSGRHAE